MEESSIDRGHISVMYRNISSQVLELLHYEILFTLEQRRQGAVLMHFLICIYAFAALAILCDEYFCASLNKICKRLEIHPDVAGATFMAAGSSMPTMFISVTSVFLDEGDIGLGTIIGSTMFNILFITGICGVATAVAIDLKPYSILRDSICYVIYLVVLLVAMYDGMIHWYEAFVVSMLYAAYVIIMRYNTTLEHHFNAWARRHFHQTRHVHSSLVKSPSKSPLRSHSKPPTYSPKKSREKIPEKLSARSPENPNEYPAKNSYAKSPLHLPKQSKEKFTENNSSSKSPDELRSESPVFEPSICASPTITHHSEVADAEKDILSKVDDPDETDFSDERSVFSDTDSTLPHTKYDEEPTDALSCPSERWPRIRWTLMFPVRVLYYITIPDCRLENWKNWYVVTFVMSIVWMGLHSYMLVWAVSVIGVTIRIPERIMGLTLLAAGSSVPDAIASLVTAEQGLGDMALANAIGSNIFDMLCLSVPWLLSTTVVHPNSVVMIHGGNILYVSLTLFGTVATTLTILYCNKWRLDRRLGAAMLTAYALFLMTAIVIESVPGNERVKHPLHRPDLPHSGLGVPHGSKHKIKTTGFTWY